MRGEFPFRERFKIKGVLQFVANRSTVDGREEMQRNEEAAVGDVDWVRGAELVLFGSLSWRRGNLFVRLYSYQPPGQVGNGVLTKL